MIKKSFYLFIFLMMAAVTCVFAQNSHELRIGTFLSGNLRGGEEILYVVRPVETGILTVETTGSIDTILEVYDDQDNFIREDDDSGEDLNARIEIVVAAGKSYYFYLSGYNDHVSGQYRIYASFRPLPVMTDLREGSVISGNLGSGEEIWYRVTSARAGILTVETASYIDTMLEVYNESFLLLDEDDDSGEGLNAKIEIDVMPGSTLYFKLSGYSTANGPYRILANLRSFPAPIQLRFGSFHSGNISSGGVYWYSVRTANSGRFVVETTGSTDTYLEAYDENYNLIAEDDDGGDGLNARIEIDGEANTTYIFKLRGFGRSTIGLYRILAILE